MSGHYHQVLVYLLCLVIHFVLQQNGYVYKYWSCVCWSPPTGPCTSSFSGDPYVYWHWSCVWSPPPGPWSPSLSRDPCRTATECICLLVLELHLVTTTRSLNTFFVSWSISYCNRMHMFISTGAASGHHHQVRVHLLSVMIHVVLQQNAYVYKYWSRVWSLPPGPRTLSLSRDPCCTATECICLQLLELCLVTTTRSSYTFFLSWSMSYCNILHIFISIAASTGHHHQVLEHLLCLVFDFILQQNAYVY